MLVAEEAVEIRVRAWQGKSIATCVHARGFYATVWCYPASARDENVANVKTASRVRRRAGTGLKSSCASSLNA